MPVRFAPYPYLSLLLNHMRKKEEPAFVMYIRGDDGRCRNGVILCDTKRFVQTI